MFQICPKCSYARKLDDTAPLGICPSCGLVYAKYNDASAKRARSALDTKARQVPSGGGARIFVKLLLFAALIAGASTLYNKTRHPHGAAHPSNAPTPPVLTGVSGTLSEREFVDLFDADTQLATLAKRGQYTVIEVYLDQCAYCRELEAAMTPFRIKREDVSFVRVHHPGSMNRGVQANSREELEAQMNALNQRMASYQLCGSPHVEVYGPRLETLALDTCKSRDGTSFLWDWITAETGIAPKSPAGMFTRM